MITQMLMDFIIDIAIKIITWLAEITPEIDIYTYMLEFTSRIITITSQANNMIHFLIGDFIVVILPLTVNLLIFKYIGYPIITFIRSIFVNGNN